MYSFNEYKLINAIKAYFTYLKDDEAAFTATYNVLFDKADVPDTDRDAFRDMVKNDKFQVKSSFTNVSSDLPTVVVVMDQEIQRENPVGDYVGETETGSEFGYFVTGVYSLFVYTKSLLLTRMLSMLLRVILEHHFNTSLTNTITEQNINVDRFSPSTDYFPNDVYMFHLTLRCVYLESYEEIYSILNGIDAYICEEQTHVVIGDIT